MASPAAPSSRATAAARRRRRTRPSRLLPATCAGRRTRGTSRESTSSSESPKPSVRRAPARSRAGARVRFFLRGAGGGQQARGRAAEVALAQRVGLLEALDGPRQGVRAVGDGERPGAAPATRRAASTRSAATAATDACASRCSASAFKRPPGGPPAAGASTRGRRRPCRSASSVRDEQFTHSASARGWARKKRSGRCLVGDGGAADPSSKTEAPSHESLPLRTIDGGSSSSFLTSARPARREQAPQVGQQLLVPIQLQIDGRVRLQNCGRVHDAVLLGVPPQRFAVDHGHELAEPKPEARVLLQALRRQRDVRRP